MQKSKDDWQSQLSTEQFAVLRQKGTEAPFSGKFLHNKKSGMYTCIGCGNQLFSSQAKFDSGSGWPSFYNVAKAGSVNLLDDQSHGMTRTEVVCAKCGGHLGHLFDDGPSDKTGKRYCINSVCLGFQPKSEPK